jgi:hypothetical protein
MPQPETRRNSTTEIRGRVGDNYPGEIPPHLMTQYAYRESPREVSDVSFDQDCTTVPTYFIDTDKLRSGNTIP